MARLTPKMFDVIECYDIYQEVKDAQWLIQSMKDAIENHWGQENLIDHLSCLLFSYDDRIKEITPRLDAAFDKAIPNNNEEMKLYQTKVQD